MNTQDSVHSIRKTSKRSLIHLMAKRSVKCAKCNGFIATEVIIAENYWIEETYCVNCGRRIHSDIWKILQKVIETPKKWKQQHGNRLKEDLKP